MSRCPSCCHLNQPQARYCAQCGVALCPPSAPYVGLQPGQALKSGAYTVERQLGKGGMGAAYLATQIIAGSPRKVVVKEMLDYFDPDDPVEAAKARRRFREEAATLVTLSHPGIPGIYDYFTEGDRNYIVMEYIAGSDLQQKISHQDEQGNRIHGQPRSTRQVLEWGIELCKVLAYLERQNPPVVHHDIKPANIILDESSGRPRLVDFGTAKARLMQQQGGQAGARKSSICGTEGYAAPEMYDQVSTPRSDVYSLAVTMYHLLTDDDPRTHPYQYPKMHTLSAEVAHALSWALNDKPERRPTAEQLCTQLGMRLGQIVTPTRAVQPFTFKKGHIARTPQELVPLCDLFWEQARGFAYEGPFEKWFADLNRHDLVSELQDITRQHENRDIGLEKFLRSLDPDLPLPQGIVTPRSVDFGLCDPLIGVPPSATICVSNGGRGCLYGAVKPSAPWLHVADQRFALVSGEARELPIQVRPDRLSWGKKRRGRVRIYTNAGRTLVDVTLRTPLRRFSRQRVMALLGFAGGLAQRAWVAAMGTLLWVLVWLLSLGALSALLGVEAWFRESFIVLTAWNALVGIVASVRWIQWNDKADLSDPEDFGWRRTWNWERALSIVWIGAANAWIAVGYYVFGSLWVPPIWIVIPMIVVLVMLIIKFPLVAFMASVPLGPVAFTFCIVWAAALVAVRSLLWNVIHTAYRTKGSKPRGTSRRAIADMMDTEL